MAIKNLDSNFRLTFFPERISVQSTVNGIFWKDSSFIKLKVRGMMGGEEMGNDWLIWIKIDSMLGFFFFFCTILCDIWAKKNIKPMPYVQSLLVLIFKLLKSWPRLYFAALFLFHCYFHFSFLAFSLRSICLPWKECGMYNETIPIRSNGKKGRTFVRCDLKQGV